jgi:hypothetical protein
MMRLEYRWTDDEAIGLTWRPYNEVLPAAQALAREAQLNGYKVKMPGKDVWLEFRAVPHGA